MQSMGTNLTQMQDTELENYVTLLKKKKKPQTLKFESLGWVVVRGYSLLLGSVNTCYMYYLSNRW